MAALPPEVRHRVLELHGEGLGRNAIANEVGISCASVTKIVADAGLSFDRSKTRVAVKARKDDMQARRTALSAELLRKAGQLLHEMDSNAWLVYNFGGKDNDYNEHVLESVPTGDKRNLIMSASTAIQRHLDIERHDIDQQTSDVRSVLRQLGEAMGVKAPESL